MRALLFAPVIVLVVAFGSVAGWDWWPYFAWPAIGVALVFALFSDTPKSAGIGAASIAFTIWTILVFVFVANAYESNRDGMTNLHGPVEAISFAAQYIGMIGVPLALGTGILATLAWWSGHRSRPANA